MKRLLVTVGLLFGLTTGAARAAQAQTRVGVSLSFGDPYFNGQVVIGRPYYHRYYPYSRYYSAPVVVYEPRYYRAPEVIVVRPRRYHARRYSRGHRW